MATPKFDMSTHIKPRGTAGYDPEAKIPWLPGAKYLGDVQWPDTSNKPKYSTITESDHFGSKTGDLFDEGAYWWAADSLLDFASSSDRR